MERALYAEDGFYLRAGGPREHFRTSAHSPHFATAIAELCARVDRALGRPARFDIVDLGAGHGELLRHLAEQLPKLHPGLAPRVRYVAVELAPRPATLPEQIEWVSAPPSGITGLLVAHEWLDNVSCEVALASGEGPRYLLVDPATGDEEPGALVEQEDRAWLERWWPLNAARAGSTPLEAPARAEVGRARDEEWASAVASLERGVALAIDYAHLRASRPEGGTLLGYREGRAVRPVPDGSCDITAHVALDAVAAAGERTGGRTVALTPQRAALATLGLTGGRPHVVLAQRDPAAYMRSLAAASEIAHLRSSEGLGGFLWLLQAWNCPTRGLL
jgi:SAM-dependent MidA family methyltransferase